MLNYNKVNYLLIIFFNSQTTDKKIDLYSSIEVKFKMIKKL